MSPVVVCRSVGGLEIAPAAEALMLRRFASALTARPSRYWRIRDAWRCPGQVCFHLRTRITSVVPLLGMTTERGAGLSQSLRHPNRSVGRIPRIVRRLLTRRDGTVIGSVTTPTEDDNMHTQPRNGGGEAYAYCKRRHRGAIAQRWTRELVIEAMCEWRER